MYEAKQAKAVKKKTLEARLTTEIAAEVEDLIGEGRLRYRFEALERAARRQALEIAAKAVARRLNAVMTDQAGSRFPAPAALRPPRGPAAKDLHRTALGEMTLERAYYHCRDCQEGFFPATGLWGWRSVPLEARRHPHDGVGCGRGQLQAY